MKIYKITFYIPSHMNNASDRNIASMKSQQRTFREITFFAIHISHDDDDYDDDNDSDGDESVAQAFHLQSRESLKEFPFSMESSLYMSVCSLILNIFARHFDDEFW